MGFAYAGLKWGYQINNIIANIYLFLILGINNVGSYYQTLVAHIKNVQVLATKIRKQK